MTWNLATRKVSRSPTFALFRYQLHTTGYYYTNIFVTWVNTCNSRIEIRVGLVQQTIWQGGSSNNGHSWYLYKKISQKPPRMKLLCFLIMNDDGWTSFKPNWLISISTFWNIDPTLPNSNNKISRNLIIILKMKSKFIWLEEPLYTEISSSSMSLCNQIGVKTSTSLGDLVYCMNLSKEKTKHCPTRAIRVDHDGNTKSHHLIVSPIFYYIW